MIEDNLKIWLDADSRVSKIKNSMKDLQEDLKNAEKDADAARDAIVAEMADTGEYEVNIPGEYCDYKIYYTTPRESVKVADADSVPDEFCKLVRTPKLKEIGEYIRDAETPPNWASIQLGEPKLTYKLEKRG